MGQENFKNLSTMLENNNGRNLISTRNVIHSASSIVPKRQTQTFATPGSNPGEMSKQHNSTNPNANCWKESVGDKQDKVYKQEDQKSATKTPNKIFNFVSNFLTGSNSK